MTKITLKEQKKLLKESIAEQNRFEAVCASPFGLSRARLAKMLLMELAIRKMAGLALYKPLPTHYDFHKSNAPERLVLGSNRAGKTTACAAEVAWAAMGCHPWLNYPKEGMRIYCVAKNESKIGEVMFKKLFRRGAYRIVFDKETGYWRGWEPWRDGYDFHKTQPSLPLIPKEAIKKIAWQKKALDCPKLVTLKNGSEISFFTAAGRPVEGVDLDMAWVDEESDSAWYNELCARLLDRRGKFIWSATPQLATQELWDLHERAQKLIGTPNPIIEEFHQKLDDNPFFSDHDKNLLKSKYANNPEQYKVRILGEFLVASHRVYPNFNRVTHGCEPFAIPQDWTRYLSIDPGFANSVALFFAVPPPDDPVHGKHIYIYDELYCHGKDVKAFAELLEPKTRGQNFEAFLIDDHGSRKHEMNGKTIAQQYAEAFEARNIKSRSNGSFFTAVGEGGSTANSPLIDGVNEVRAWLWKQDNGQPILKIFTAYCPELCDEMSAYKNIADKKTGKATDKPDCSKYSHGPDAVRYAKIYGVRYVPPSKRKPEPSGVVKYFRDKMKRKRKESGNSVNM